MLQWYSTLYMAICATSIDWDRFFTVHNTIWWIVNGAAIWFLCVMLKRWQTWCGVQNGQGCLQLLDYLSKLWDAPKHKYWGAHSGGDLHRTAGFVAIFSSVSVVCASLQSSSQMSSFQWISGVGLAAHWCWPILTHYRAIAWCMLG